VRLYLSWFQMGNHPEHLAALVGGDGRNVVVIANALDDAPADVRRSGLERELAALADLGFDGVELDLRNYFGQEQRLRRDLAGAPSPGTVPSAPARRAGSPHRWPRHQDRVVPPSAWARLLKEPDGFRSNTAALVTA
jgi:hypothetical protein